jgi:hypothetical protein
VTFTSPTPRGRLLTRRKVAKKPSTLATDRGRIERHVKPLLGRMTVAAVQREDIERFTHAVAEGETAARIKTGLHGLARVQGGKGTANPDDITQIERPYGGNLILAANEVAVFFGDSNLTDLEVEQ